MQGQVKNLQKLCLNWRDFYKTWNMPRKLVFNQDWRRQSQSFAAEGIEFNFVWCFREYSSTSSLGDLIDLSGAIQVGRRSDEFRNRGKFTELTFLSWNAGYWWQADRSSRFGELPSHGPGEKSLKGEGGSFWIKKYIADLFYLQIWIKIKQEWMGIYIA